MSFYKKETILGKTFRYTYGSIIEKYLSVFLYIVLSITFSPVLEAQVLYSPSYQDGDFGIGAITKIDIANKEHTTEFSFPSPYQGKRPRSRLVEHEGKLYGTTANGGVHSSGLIFRFDPTDGSYEKLFDFKNDSLGNFPSNITLQDGKLYGTTQHGGKYDDGVLFSFDIESLAFQKLMDFEDSVSGEWPSASPTFLGGKLYGSTQRGSSKGYGLLFSYELESGVYKKIHEFDGINTGAYPYAGLTIHEGKLYGTTPNGGATGSGTIFMIDPTNESHTVLFDFYGPESGTGPFGDLTVFGKKFYGTTRFGGMNTVALGVLFSFDPLTLEFKKLHTFLSGDENGGSPLATLTALGSKLFGTTNSGGINGNGVMFSFDTLSGVFEKILDFKDIENGRGPLKGLTVFNNKLYGSTEFGGTNDNGTLFSFAPDGTGYQKQFDFSEGPLGSGPTSWQLFNNVFYGTTEKGGEHGDGTIFSFDPVSSTFEKLIDFQDTVSGKNPRAMKIFEGKFYGVTREGGKNGDGTMFMYDPLQNGYQKLFDFDDTVSGEEPLTFTIYDNKLYGLTFLGGSYDNGVFFTYDPLSAEFKKLYEYDLEVILPYASGFAPMDSILYGTTLFGGEFKKGTLFSFDISDYSYKKLHDFDVHSKFPLYSHNEKIYGGVTRDGAEVLFAFDPLTQDYQEVLDIGTTFLEPYIYGGSFKDQKFYGYTKSGGANGDGSIFSIDLDDLSIENIYDFDIKEGIYFPSDIMIFKPPTITGLSDTIAVPRSKVEILGTDFIGISSLTIGDYGIEDFSIENDTLITFLVPDENIKGNIKITSIAGSVVSQDMFAVALDNSLSVPQDLQAIDIGTDYVLLEWSPTEEDIKGYILERSEDTTFLQIEVFDLDSITISYRDSGLVPESDYFYRLKAYNEVTSSAYSDTLSVRTQTEMPGAPSGLTVTYEEGGFPLLEWQDNSNGEIGFELQRSIELDFDPFVSFILPNGTNMFLDTTAEVGRSYNYRVRAMDGTYTSPFSNEVNLSVTSLGQLSESGIHIYPNPAGDHLNIGIEDIAGNRLHIRMFDDTGKEVISRKWGINDKVLDISFLRPGIYHLIMVSERTTLSRKISVFRK